MKAGTRDEGRGAREERLARDSIVGILLWTPARVRLAFRAPITARPPPLVPPLLAPRPPPLAPAPQ